MAKEKSRLIHRPAIELKFTPKYGNALFLTIFNELQMEKNNEKQVTYLQLTKDSTSELMKTYFTKVFELKQSGKEFPINLDDVWPLAYGRKDEAVRSLKSDFVENEDYQPLRKNGERSFKATKGGGHNRIDYMLSVKCLEYFVAKKVKPVFEVYRQVFHKTIEAGSKSKAITENGGYNENQLFIGRLGRISIKGYFTSGELWYSLNSLMKFIGYESGGGHLYANKFGAQCCRFVEDGKQATWFVNMQWCDEFFRTVKREIAYERITTLYRDLFHIDKAPIDKSPYTYHFTAEEILAIINEVNQFKQKPALVQSIVERIMQGGGR